MNIGDDNKDIRQTKTAPKVTILVLNYFHWNDTVECIRSIQECTYSNYDIMLIDNASPNDSEMQLRKIFPDLILLQTEKNLGYTGGINFGIKKALQGDAEYVLVINPDTTVERKFLDHLVAGMLENPTVAVTGGTIFHSDDTKRVWYAGGRLIPWKGYAEHFDILNNTATSGSPTYKRVTFVTGCLMLLRVNALKSIGFLDERFFMYLDDIEFCARVQRHGFDLLYVPQAIIFHKLVSEENAIYKLYFTMRNRFLLIRTAFSGVPRWTAMVLFSISIMRRMFIWQFNNVKFYQATRMGIEDYFARRFGPGRGFEYLTKHQSQDESTKR